MAKAPPSFQFYPADFLIGIAGMSHSSQATYIKLLCYEWIQAKLVFDPSKLSKMIGLTIEEFNKDWEEVACKFILNEDGTIHNERLETIRSKALTRSEIFREAGRKGGHEKARNMKSSQAIARLKPGSSSSVFSLQSSFKNPLPPFLENDRFRETLQEWLEYKRWKYTEAGFKKLITRARKRAEAHGLDAVIDAMESAMANNYQGWDFDRAFTNNKPKRELAEPRLAGPWMDPEGDR